MSVESNTADREIVITRVLEFPRALVYRAWTDPQHMVQWWGPNGFTTTLIESDVRPGGLKRYIMHGPDGTDYNNRVQFEEVTPPERLVYMHGSDEQPNQFHATVTFTELGELTELKLRLLFDTVEECEAKKKFGAIEGGNQTLARLAEYLKTMN